MKYPCSDGIDRDESIEAYLICINDLEIAHQKMTDLTRKREVLENKLKDLSFNKLGLIGLLAIFRELKVRKT